MLLTPTTESTLNMQSPSTLVAYGDVENRQSVQSIALGTSSSRGGGPRGRAHKGI